jgi:dUTPase
LPIDKHLTLSPKIQCYEITGVYGPLPTGTVEIILGRSRLTSQGFIVYPGVIDEDFKGEIKIMAYIKREMQFKADDGAAQLLLFPYIKAKVTSVDRAGEVS